MVFLKAFVIFLALLSFVLMVMLGIFVNCVSDIFTDNNEKEEDDETQTWTEDFHRRC